MTDTTVTVETPDDEGSESPDNESGNGHETAQASATVEASTAAAENKAHSEHAATEAKEAANEAKDHNQMAEWSAQSAQEAVQTIAGFADTVVSAVNSIPEKIAEAMASVVPSESSTAGPDLDIEPEPLSPATPPSRRKFKDWYYGAGKGGK